MSHSPHRFSPARRRPMHLCSLDCLHFTRYGTIDGKVINVSPDAVDLRNAPNLSEAAAAVRPQSGAPSAPNSGQGGPALAFPATIAPSRDSLAIEGKDVK